MLTQNQSTKEENSFKAEDIAVLCGTNQQASMVKSALFDLGLQSVLLNRDSVYQSDEAADLLLILEAVADPANHARIRAALGTRILHQKELLLKLNQDQQDEHMLQQAFEDWLFYFQEWHQQWNDNGLIPMLRTLLKECKGREQLISYANGERRLTNLNHLMEQLSKTEKERPGEMFYLLEHLRKNIHESAKPKYQTGSEEEELRLESDRDLVKIVTIHRSKGLEYKVVVTPFLWDGINASKISRNDFFVYHDPDDLSNKRVDIDGEMYPDTKYRYFQEDFADHLRVAYVALTRGIHHNILIHVPMALNYQDKGKSGYAAIDYVLTGRERYQKALRKMFKSHIDVGETNWLSYPEITGKIKQISEKSGGTISCEVWDEEAVAADEDNNTDDEVISIQQVKQFTNHRQLKPAWSIASYSSLTRYSTDHDELMDFSAEKIDDREEEEPEGETRPSLNERTKSIFNFPKGAQTGLCWHRIFELIPFHQPRDWEKIVAEELASHEFETGPWKHVILEMVNRTMQKNLRPSHKNDLRLANLHPDAVRKEMEFHFGFDQADGEAMLSIIRNVRKEGDSKPDENRPGLLKGLMKGFIDLIFCHDNAFYILDYKSNHLGSEVEDYHQEALSQSVNESLYDLQYYIYTLALHRYLKHHLGKAYSYEKNFGGVFYLYLRGIQPGENVPQTGIYFDRPEHRAINALNNYLNHV